MTLKKLFILLFLITGLSTHALPTAKVTVRVIDENGKPIEGARVGCNFETPKKNGLGVSSKHKSDLSNSNGLFTVSGFTGQYGVGCSAKKEGHYAGNAGSGRFTGVSGEVGFRKWKPWNPTIDVVLKSIINPIPMFVAENTGKGITYDPPLSLPEEGRDFGYDLIANDWVVPYGKGLHSDFLFKISVAHFSVDPIEYDTTLSINFSNQDDGIQSFFVSRNIGSGLKSQYQAPLSGYKNKLSIRRIREKNKVVQKTYRDDQNYYFRVRTKRDEQGNIIEALYGKIYGNLIFSSPREEKKGKIYFTYYLNPNNNDTNMEFSPEKSLFPEPENVRGRYRFKP